MNPRSPGARVRLEKAVPPVLGKENGAEGSVRRLGIFLLSGTGDNGKGVIFGSEVSIGPFLVCARSRANGTKIGGRDR